MLISHSGLHRGGLTTDELNTWQRAVATTTPPNSQRQKKVRQPQAVIWGPSLLIRPRATKPHAAPLVSDKKLNWMRTYEHNLWYWTVLQWRLVGACSFHLKVFETRSHRTKRLIGFGEWLTQFAAFESFLIWIVRGQRKIFAVFNEWLKPFTALDQSAFLSDLVCGVSLLSGQSCIHSQVTRLYADFNIFPIHGIDERKFKNCIIRRTRCITCMTWITHVESSAFMHSIEHVEVIRVIRSWRPRSWNQDHQFNILDLSITSSIGVL